MPRELKNWLSKEAQTRGLTLTGLIMAILSEYRRQR
nr:MAG TPA: repressor [Caudoviricetes sp.]